MAVAKYEKVINVNGIPESVLAGYGTKACIIMTNCERERRGETLGILDVRGWLLVTVYLGC